MENPLGAHILFHIGPLPVDAAVVVTWGLIAGLGLGSWWATRRLSLTPGRLQSVLELLVSTIDAQITDTVRGDPARFRPLIGTLLVFILCANWSSLIPGVEAPTARLETDAALALIVFAATLWFGIRVNGLGGYLAGFARPTWVMLPMNLVEQLTRHLSLMVRLFGNVMSGGFVIAILLGLAGLLVPIPIMALDMLTGAVQSYIFAILALVFIGSAVEGEGDAHKETDA